MNLRSMSVGELLKLRSDITERLQARKSEIEAMLTELDEGVRPENKPVRLKRSKAAARYRHPTTGEEWSGRGGIARWLAAEIKAGKNKDDFLVGAAKTKAKRA